jgi:2-methylisocitrate lyase-like PEP mutase family enzyme
MGKVDDFRRWHHGDAPLVLPNAWDAESAKTLAAVTGCRAVATSSAACARSLGYEDGELIPRDEMLACVERIARAVDVPVTADLEAGYGDPARTARDAWRAGAVGMNLEDQNRPLEEAVEALRAARLAAPLVLNARVDVFLPGATGDLDEAIERARAYVDAGADCVYPIMLTDRDAIERFVREVDAPVNVIVTPTTPPFAELRRLGVARITFGSGLHRVALAAASEAAEAWLVETAQ